MNSNHDSDVMRQAKALFDHSLETIDPATTRRLRELRRAAVKQQRGPAWQAARLAWIPAAAVVLLAVAGGLRVWLHKPAPAPAVLPDATDVDLLMSNRKLEFYENLDFYTWLARQHNQHNAD